MGVRFKSHRDLDVYKMAFESAMQVFHLTKKFPKEERYSLTDQMRRSSRSFCLNIAEAYFKRNYPASFVHKLSDSISEAAETQVWREFAVECRYLNATETDGLAIRYGFIIGKLVTMMHHPEDWRL